MADAELSDYQAAAYRVLTACEYSMAESYRVDGQSITVPQALLDDARMVIERWNADHPADDDEPITPEWVEETWPIQTDDGPVIVDKPMVKLIYQGGGDWALCIYPQTGDGEWDSEKMRDVDTRGDVREFLRGIGCKTNESVASGTLQGSGSDREGRESELPKLSDMLGSMSRTGLDSVAAVREIRDNLPLQSSGSNREELFGIRQYPGCSCHACGGISPAGDTPGTWFNACQSCQHKRCPHCDDHRFECTESNAPGQVGTLSTKGGDA